MTSLTKKVINYTKLQRTGIVDIGSNTVRLVVFDGPSRSPRYFYNEKVNCGLGVGLRQTKFLNNKGKQKAYKAIQRFSAILKTMSIVEIYFVATSAVEMQKMELNLLKALKKNSILKSILFQVKRKGY